MNIQKNFLGVLVFISLFFLSSTTVFAATPNIKVKPISTSVEATDIFGEIGNWGNFSITFSVEAIGSDAYIPMLFLANNFFAPGIEIENYNRFSIYGDDGMVLYGWGSGVNTDAEITANQNILIHEGDKESITLFVNYPNYGDAGNYYMKMRTLMWNTVDADFVTETGYQTKHLFDFPFQTELLYLNS